MEKVIVGGVEGGSTRSVIVLLDSDGKLLATANGPCTNHFLLGLPECQKRIAELVNSAKATAGISEKVPLTALGLSLSGCEDEHTNQEFVRGLLERYPDLSKQYAIGSDTQGSVQVVSNKGGITCIAGTGSNTLLINPDGSTVQCGGWGYLLGDKGSAWNISYSAVKICYDDIDNYVKAPHSIDTVWSLVKSHFNTTSQHDLLTYFYTDFNKANIAALCKKISDCANEGDQFSISLFHEAGEQLARSLAAVIPKASPELTNAAGGLQVVCVGSVWLSWNLLQKGFVPYLNNNCDIPELRLVKLKTSMAFGAAYMAADRLNISLPRDYEKNYEVFYHYKKGPRSVCAAM